jgi:hypothetical protein
MVTKHQKANFKVRHYPLLAHHDVHNGTHHPCLFEGVRGHVHLSFQLENLTAAFSFAGALDVDQGTSNVRSTPNDSFRLVAQAFGLVVEAAGGGTPFHEALLWALVGQGSGAGEIHFPSLNRRLEDTVERVATLPHHAPTFGVRAPHILGMAQLEALRPWLEKAVSTTCAAAQLAFLDTLAAIRPLDALDQPTP